MDSLKGWLAFEPKSISAQTAPGGPWGFRYIEWTANEDGHFSAESIKRFAAGQHFDYVSEFEVSPEKMGGWKTLKGETIFPLSQYGYTGDDPKFIADDLWQYFPRTNTAASVVLKFDTHWLLVNGGVEKPAYAYALLSKDGRKLALYHCWGE